MTALRIYAGPVARQHIEHHGLQAADVGIAVKGSVDLSLNSADVYFTRGGLAPLFDLFDAS